MNDWRVIQRLMRAVGDLGAELGSDFSAMRDTDLGTWMAWAQAELLRGQHTLAYTRDPEARDAAMCNVIKAFATLFFAVKYNATPDS